MKQFFKKIFIFSQLFLVSSSLLNCRTFIRESFVRSYQTYKGRPLPKEKVAFVSSNGPPIVFRIDGKYNQAMIFNEFSELLPGKHSMCIGYRDKYDSSNQCINLNINLKPGHIYQLYRVKYTHKPAWYPAIWDVSAEINTPEQHELRAVFYKMLEKTRGVKVSVQKNISIKNRKKIHGFSEILKIVFKGKDGKNVEGEYKFNRYKPYITTVANDELEYHLKISQKNGALLKVIGTKVWLGGFMSGKISAFQPIDSIYAYIDFNSVNLSGYAINNPLFSVHKEISPGEYNKVKGNYFGRYGRFKYFALLDVSGVKDLPKKARRALVFAINSRPSKIINNKPVVKMLSRKYRLGSKGYNLAVKKLALKLSNEAVSIANNLLKDYQKNTIEYTKIMSILTFSNKKLKQIKASLSND